MDFDAARRCHRLVTLDLSDLPSQRENVAMNEEELKQKLDESERQRVALLEVFRPLRLAIREILWIALVWNDHNHSAETIRRKAENIARDLGVNRLDESADKFLNHLDAALSGQYATEFVPRAELEHAQDALVTFQEDNKRLCSHITKLADQLAQLEQAQGEPVGEIGELQVFFLKRQNNGDRWPAGTKLYTAPQPAPAVVLPKAK